MEFVRAIESSDINPDLVMIEIAGAFQEDEYLVRDHLLFLKKHGIRVAMDFFSAAKSPFMLLSDVPLDVIKINREITAAYNQPKGASLIQSIVSFAKANQIKTVAEGVENDFQATYCANAGVDYLQGYFFSVPQLMTVQENEASSSSDESQAGVEYPDISIVPKE